MLHHGTEHSQSIPHAARTSGKIDHQRLSADARPTPREHRRWQTFRPPRADGLGNPRRLPLKDGSHRLRRHVARSEAGPPGGDDDIERAAVRPSDQRARNRTLIVGDYFMPTWLMLPLATPVDDGCTAPIFSYTCGAAV
jgi:hypothetical protein